MLVRLQKFLADAGVASRRASEQIILAGRVAVNGVAVRELGAKVDPVQDEVSLDGTRLRAKRKLYVALNKPPRYLCSRQDSLNRRLVGELLPREWSNLYSVGRLDYESEGLIFLTNDGDFCLQLTHPRYGVHKTYRVVVAGRADSETVGRLVRGVEQHGERLKAEKARLLSANNSRSVLEIVMAEGRNREVRRLLESQGHVVERLQRLRIGPITLGDLPTGKWRVLQEAEIGALLGRRT